MAETIVNYAGKRQLTMASYEGKTELVDNLDYDIIDYPVDGITNEQMTFALTCKRLFPAGSTFICKDAGTYKAGHTYQIKVSGETKSWEDISDIIKYTAGTNITISDTNVISAKVPTKTSELTNDSEFINTATLNSELTKKQNNLTEEQMLAVNSGITTEKVTQIGTNTTNISELDKKVDENLQIAKDYTDTKFNGASKAVAYADYSTMITALNTLAKDTYKVGQNINIITLNVPDLWVSAVNVTAATYTYVDDTTFINALKTSGSIQVGYFSLSALETQKIDLTDYYTKEQVDTKLEDKQSKLNEAQLKAVNSGITSEKVTQIDTNSSDIANLKTDKQDKLKVGENINIADDNTISAVVPTKTSDLTNDSGFIDSTKLDTELGKKQDSLTANQLAAVNSGITAEKVTDIATNKSDIATLETSKQDKLSDSQLLAINSGATEDKINQIGLNTTAIENKQDKLTETQLTAVNSGITDTKVAQISTNATNITALQEQIGNIDTLLTQLDSGSGV